MIAFVTALKEEREAVRRSWKISPAGSLQGFELEVGDGCAHLCAGMGEHRMAQAVELLRRTYSPSLFVLVGFSVGLKPDFQVGDLVCDTRSDSELQALLQQLELPLRFGKVSTCGFLNSSAHKKAFADKHPVSVVADLESEAFLETVKPLSRVLVVRVVSDCLNSDLPLNFGELVDKRGFPDLKAIGLKVALRPYLLPRLVRLGRDAGFATRVLANFLSESRELLVESIRER